jgi:hypothetical protein
MYVCTYRHEEIKMKMKMKITSGQNSPLLKWQGTETQATNYIYEGLGDRSTSTTAPSKAWSIEGPYTTVQRELPRLRMNGHQPIFHACTIHALCVSTCYFFSFGASAYETDHQLPRAAFLPGAVFPLSHFVSVSRFFCQLYLGRGATENYSNGARERELCALWPLYAQVTGCT